MTIRRNAAACAVLAALCCPPLGAQPANAPVLRMVRELRIDGAAHDLSSISGLAVAPGGQVVFVEPQDSRLRFYSAAGDELARFGRRGQGPGEFTVSPGRRPPVSDVRIGTIGDTVWAYDHGLRRFTLASLDGRLLRTVPQSDKLPSLRGGGTPPEPGTERRVLAFDPEMLFADGSMLGRATWGNIEVVMSGDSPVRMMRNSESGFATASAGGDITTVLAMTPRLENFVEIQRNGGLGSWGMSVPFAEGFYQSLAPDGSRIAFGQTTITSDRTGTLQLTVIGIRGDTLLHRAHSFVATPVTRRMADSAIENRMRSAAQNPDAGEMEAKLRAAIPRAASAYRTLLLGADYSLWLGAPIRDNAREYLILTERGEPYGRLSVPRNISVRRATRSMLWAVETDEDGLPSIVRYRIER